MRLKAGQYDSFVRARIITVVIMCLCSGVYKTRCLRDGVRGVRARRGTTVKDFERQGALYKSTRLKLKSV